MTRATIEQQQVEKIEGETTGTFASQTLSSSVTPDRPRRARTWALLATGAAIVSLAGAAWLRQSGQVQFSERSISTTASERLITIEPQPVSSQLDMMGTIAAGKSVAIVAPFDGVIREKRVQLGDHVGVGDVLVVMDTSEIASRYRDAQSAYLKAAMATEAMEKWETGSEMQRARRALEAAQTSLASLERQVVEIQTLLDQGIVSRNEYDGMVQQRDTQRMTVAGAKDELAATLDRGNAVNRQLVTLELENAQSRLNDLKQQMAGAKVATAVRGVLTRPPLNGNGQGPVSTEPGASLTRGTAIFSIADTSSFVVTGAVDEVDVNRMKVGQRVIIASDAFPENTIEGRIVSVSAEAGSEGNLGRAPAFEVRAAFAVNDEVLRRAIRIGMSARMTVETYSNPQALIVPVNAIISGGSGPQVRVQKRGKMLSVPILVGATFPAGVEILSGISAGEQVYTN